MASGAPTDTDVVWTGAGGISDRCVPTSGGGVSERAEICAVVAVSGPLALRWVQRATQNLRVRFAYCESVGGPLFQLQLFCQQCVAT